ncbi:small ubiquitin-related modifier 2-like [Trifolium pratense]|uniref:small ubiquitin-related modifier 2-like n=1 Tax=Trifolium pratense TaxID=57577 RepID=UPI001E69037D|nr:small ubiquitin-related modifier 2-like [Trifolium pratense]
MDSQRYKVSGARENSKASSGITEIEEDKKPVIERGTHINIKIKDQYNNEVSILIKRSTTLKNILITYCNERSMNFNTFRFLLGDGVRLRVDKTPDELGMKDGDQIDAFLEQFAGA